MFFKSLGNHPHFHAPRQLSPMHHTHRACRSLLALNAARQLELLATPVVSRGLLLCFRFTRAFVSFRQRSSSFAFSALPAHAVRMRMFCAKCPSVCTLGVCLLIFLFTWCPACMCFLCWRALRYSFCRQLHRQLLFAANTVVIAVLGIAYGNVLSFASFAVSTVTCSCQLAGSSVVLTSLLYCYAYALSEVAAAFLCSCWHFLARCWLHSSDRTQTGWVTVWVLEWLTDWQHDCPTV